MESPHWTEEKELKGAAWQYRLIAFMLTRLGPQVMRLLAFPIALGFFLFSPAKRRYSREFLNRRASIVRGEHSNPCRHPARPTVLKHFHAFALALGDKISAWSKDFGIRDLEIDDDYSEFIGDLRAGRGVLVLCSHLGNIEVFRAFGQLHSNRVPDLKIASVLNPGITTGFSDFIRSINPESTANIVPADDVGPETILRLRDFAAGGGMVVIAGDRTSPGARDRVFRLPFFGSEADFPYGPFLMADLLDLPVYEIFVLRKRPLKIRSGYRIHLHRAPDLTGGGRRDRQERLKGMAEHYAANLQRHASEEPLQWFNFYPFWG